MNADAADFFHESGFGKYFTVSFRI